MIGVSAGCVSCVIIVSYMLYLNWRTRNLKHELKIAKARSRSNMNVSSQHPKTDTLDKQNQTQNQMQKQEREQNPRSVRNGHVQSPQIQNSQINGNCHDQLQPRKDINESNAAVVVIAYQNKDDAMANKNSLEDTTTTFGRYGTDTAEELFRVQQGATQDIVTRTGYVTTTNRDKETPRSTLTSSGDGALHGQSCKNPSSFTQRVTQTSTQLGVNYTILKKIDHEAQHPRDYSDEQYIYEGR